MLVDLHIHTTASDGVDSPVEVVARAKSLGLKAIAVTDHDTLEGIKPACDAGISYNIEVLPGVELGSEHLGDEIHILGYLVKQDNRELLEKLKLFRDKRISRMEKMVKKIQEFGFPVDMSMVMAISGAGSVGRPHLAEALVKIGVVDTMGEAFEKYIGAGRPAYIPRHKLSPAEAVRLIITAGGVPVMAHPGLNNAAQFIEELISIGLAGVEAYHPVHSQEEMSYYLRLAQKHDLIVTGGSDYHGPGHKTGRRIGLVTMPYSVVNELRKKAGHII